MPSMNSRFRLLVGFSVFLFWCIYAAPAYSEGGLVIGIDKSGSMKNYFPWTILAASNVVDLMPDGTGVAIVSFGGTATELIRVESLDPPNRTALKRALAELQPNRQHTNYDLAFEEFSRDQFVECCFGRRKI